MLENSMFVCLPVFTYYSFYHYSRLSVDVFKAYVEKICNWIYPSNWIRSSKQHLAIISYTKVTCRVDCRNRLFICSFLVLILPIFFFFQCLWFSLMVWWLSQNFCSAETRHLVIHKSDDDAHKILFQWHVFYLMLFSREDSYENLKKHDDRILKPNKNKQWGRKIQAKL